jgi:hypothetical protein
LFIGEFADIDDADKGKMAAGVDRNPAQMIAYQLGWMSLLRKWDADELAGESPEMPAPGIKWNALGKLYQRFYEEYEAYPLKNLAAQFKSAVEGLCGWVDGFSDDKLFRPGGRKWASSTPSNWPVWKWVHVNTAAPFKSFRGKIRKWKKAL